MRPRCAKNHAEWVCIRQFEVINTLGMRDTLSKTINTAHFVLMFFSTFLGLSCLLASWQTHQNGQSYGSPKPSWCFVFAMFVVVGWVVCSFEPPLKLKVLRVEIVCSRMPHIASCHNEQLGIMVPLYRFIVAQKKLSQKRSGERPSEVLISNCSRMS